MHFAHIPSTPFLNARKQVLHFGSLRPFLLMLSGIGISFENMRSSESPFGRIVSSNSSREELILRNLFRTCIRKPLYFSRISGQLSYESNQYSLSSKTDRNLSCPPFPRTRHKETHPAYNKVGQDIKSSLSVPISKTLQNLNM